MQNFVGEKLFTIFLKEIIHRLISVWRVISASFKVWITLFVAIAFLIHILWVQISYAAVPRILSYQLRLTDSSGIPVADGTVDIIISIYDAASGGSRVHTDCGTVGTPTSRKVVFTNGVGSVLIGDTAASGSTNCSDGSAPNAIAATVFDSNARYLGITVEADAEMTPRKRIVAGAFALNSDKLDDLDTSNAGGTTAFVPVTDSSGLLTLTGNPTTTTAVITANSAAATSELLLDLKTSNTTVFKVDAEGDTTISGQTQITGRASVVITGSIDPTASTAVVGVGTAFTTELEVGDLITVSGTTRLITAIADDNNLTVDQAFTDLANDASVDRLPSSFTLLDSSGVGRATMLSTGSLIAGRMLNPFSFPGSVSSGLQAIRPVETSGNMAATFFGATLYPNLGATEPSVYAFTGGCSNMQLAGAGELHINSSGTGQSTIGGIGSQGRISAGCNPAFGNFGLVIGVSQSSKFEPYAVLSNFGQLGLRVPLADDDVYRILLDSNRGGTQPKISFGPGTSSALDVSIARTASGTLSIRNAANDADAAFTASSGTFSGAIAANGDSITSDADLTVTPAGGDFILAGGVTFNVGGSGSDVAYNVVGDSTAGASGAMDSDDDLYIEGSLEVDGNLVFGAASTNTIAVNASISTDLQFPAANGSTYNVFVNQSAATQAGSALSLFSADGGEASGAAVGGNGGSLILFSGTGGNGSATHAPGNGANVTISAGAGGADGGTGTAGDGGSILIDAGSGDTDGTIQIGNIASLVAIGQAANSLVEIGTTTTSTTLFAGTGGISADFTAGTNLFNILDGNLKVGNGVPTVALDGEDVYIEGNLEVDGTTNFADLSCTDCLDFAEFEDTLDLDANLTLNQSTSTWSQSFTGAATNGLTYTAASLTTGDAVVITGSGATMQDGGILLDLNMGAATAGSGIDLSSTGVYTSTLGVLAVRADSLTSGTLSLMSASGLTSGTLLSLSGGGSNMLAAGTVVHASMGAATVGVGILANTTGVYTGAGIVQISASAATTGKGLNMLLSGLTTGTAIDITGGGANMLAGGELINADMGAATAGNGVVITSSGVYTGTGLLSLSGNSATTGVGVNLSMTGLTSGTGIRVTGGTSMSLSGELLDLDMGASTNGAAVRITTTGNHGNAPLVNVIANSSTSGQLIDLSMTSITDGQAFTLTGGSSMTGVGRLMVLNMGAATDGTALNISNGGAYTGSGIIALSANSATTGTLFDVAADALTTGRIIDIANVSLTSGTLIHAQSSNTTAGTEFTGRMLNLASNRTYTSNLSANDTSGMIQLSKTITANNSAFDDFSAGISLNVADEYNVTDAGASGLRVSAAVAKITRSGSAAASETLNISANLFELQDSDLSGAGTLTNSGHVLSIQQLDAGATGQMIFMDSETATSTQNVILIQTDVAANDDTAWRVRADGSTFADNAYTGTGADYAEYFKAGVNSIEKGIIVALDENGLVVPATETKDPVVGVISTNPGFIGNNIEGANGTLEDNTDYALVGLTGQIPTFVSVAGGAIMPGDAIALSETAGVGVKTTEPGYVVGYALEGTTVDGKIMVYVHAGWYAGEDAIGGISGFAALPTLSDVNSADYGVFGAIASSVGVWSLDSEGKLLAKEITADKLTTKEIAIDATEEQTSIGEGVIVAGTNSITVENSIAKPNSKIFITLYSAFDGAWWISSRENGKFTITLSKLFASDVVFEYMIVSVVDPALIEPEDDFISINEAASMGVVAGAGDSSDENVVEDQPPADEVPAIEEEPVVIEQPVVEEGDAGDNEVIEELVVEEPIVEDSISEDISDESVSEEVISE